MNSEQSEPRYVISVAARIVGIETHTLRYYERLGLLQPYRSEGNVRYYSESDIERLRYIRTLTEDLGLNLAGVEVVTRMVQKMAEMQKQIEEMERKIERLTEDEPAKNKELSKGVKNGKNAS